MATDVGELVVSLAFESGDAKAEMKALVREVGNIDKSFEALALEAGGFGKSLDGAKLKAQSLTQQLEAQNKVVAQAAKETAAANQKLQDAQKRQGDLKTKVDASTQAHEKLGAELKDTKTQWEASKKAMGDNSDEANALGVKVLELEDAYKKSGTELQKLNGQQKQADKDVKNSALNLQYYAGQEDAAKVAAGKLQQALEKANKEFKKQSGLLNAPKLKEYGDALSRTADQQVRLGRAFTTGVTLPIVGGLAYSAKAAIDFQDSFAGVEKTVDGTDEQLAGIRQGIIDMINVKGMPQTVDELNGIAAAGGQLGVETPNIIGFTKVMADLKESTNLGDDGASQMAKFANITGMAQTEFDRAGSTIVELGNNSATTETDIMAMSMRLAGAGKTVGMLPPQIMGFAAALSSLGIEADAGGSSISKLMVDMQLAVETGKNGLKDYAKIAGMTSKEFQTAFKTDAAGAIASFVAGLGTGGQSAIKILDDIGVTEVRMRDSLLRASNASGLFSKSITMANGAWKSNTALTTEANKRYATFASQMKNAGNQAKLAAMAFGEDMMPTLQGGLKVVTGLMKGIGDLNEQTRGMAMSAALAAAGIGPGITLIGKGNQAIAGAAKGLATFKSAVVDAGGGVGGFVKSLGGAFGPMGVAALAVAVGAGVYAWYDWASGAKAARDALDGINETAKKWKETQATTIFDTGNDPLARFGLSKESFSGGQSELEDWMSRLTETWSDGKKETAEIVKSYVDEFTQGSDKIRAAIKARKKTQEKFGVTDDKTTSEDLKKLDQYDKQVAALLKKKRNGKLSEKDTATLNQLIQERVQIQLKYTTGEGGGYDSLEKAVEAEKARLASENKTPGADLYGDALTGAAQGYQTQVDAINQSYRDQYADIMAITDEKERQDALTQLNLEHTEALKKAQEEYNKVLGQYAPETFQTPEMEQAQTDLQTLTDKITAYNEALKNGTATPEDLKSLETLIDGMDEGKLASLKTLIDQLNQNGLGNLNLGGEGEPAITANDLLGGYNTVADFLKANKGEWTGGLSELFGAVDEESNRIRVSMGLTPESQTLMDNLTAMEKAGVQVLINAYVPTDTTLVTPPATMVDAMIGAYKAAVNAGVQQPDAKVEALISAYNEADGATVSYPKEQVDALIKAYNEAEGAGVAAPSATTTAEISAYQEQTGASVAMPSEAVQAFIDQYKAAANAGVAPPNKDVDAFIAGYVNTPNTTVAVPATTVNALISAYRASEGATTAPPNDTVTAVISQYVSAAGAVTPQPTVYAKASVDFSPLDQAALDAYYKANPGSKPSVTTDVGLQSGWAGKLQTAYDQGILSVWKDGVKLDITPEIVKQIGITDVWAGTVDKDGKTVHVDVVMTPKLGTPESVEQSQGQMDKKPQNFLPDWLKSSTSDKVTSIASLAQGVEDLAEAGDTLSAQQGKSVLLEQLNELNPTDLQNIGAYIANAMAALSSGTLTPEDAAEVQAQLDALLAVVRAADQYLGVGNDISAGIASGMTTYGWTGDATTIASSIEAALRAAADSHSPAQKYVPLGSDISAGVGQGMKGYSFAADALATSGNLKSGLDIAFASLKSDGQTYGQRLGDGIKKGLEDRRHDVVAKAKQIADEVKRTIRQAWDINSPSKEGQWLSGMLMKGLEIPIEREMPDIIGMLDDLELRSARAREATRIDNRKSYQIAQQGGVTVNGNFNLRDKQDIRALALELHALEVSENQALGSVYPNG